MNKDIKFCSKCHKRIDKPAMLKSANIVSEKGYISVGCACGGKVKFECKKPIVEEVKKGISYGK